MIEYKNASDQQKDIIFAIFKTTLILLECQKHYQVEAVGDNLLIKNSTESPPNQTSKNKIFSFMKNCVDSNCFIITGQLLALKQIQFFKKNKPLYKPGMNYDPTQFEIKEFTENIVNKKHPHKSNNREKHIEYFLLRFILRTNNLRDCYRLFEKDGILFLRESTQSPPKRKMKNTLSKICDLLIQKKLFVIDKNSSLELKADQTNVHVLAFKFEKFNSDLVQRRHREKGHGKDKKKRLKRRKGKSVPMKRMRQAQEKISKKPGVPAAAEKQSSMTRTQSFNK